MKQFLYPAAGLLVLAAGFTSCSDDGYTAGPAAEGAYFATDAAERLNFFYEDTKAELKMVRTNADAEQTFAVELTDTTGFFTCPDAITFAAGEKEATLVLTFDPYKFEPKDYGINIHIVGGYTYGLVDYSPIVGLDDSLRWGDMEGMATYTEDIVGTVYGVGAVTYQVPVQKKIGVKDVYRLVNPYGEWYPYNEPGDYDTTKDYYLVINASDPDNVYVEDGLTGTDWGNGVMRVAWYGALVAPGAPLDGKYGEFKDGVITMPASLYLVMSGNPYGPNAGEFKVVLPTVEDNEE